MPNQWTKAKDSGIPYVISDETRRKMSESATNGNINRWSSEENRKLQSESMKRAVKENPASYTSSNRGRTKQIIYKDVKFQGKWELDFYIWCENNNIRIERCEECFDYEWNGNRSYFPDFRLPDYGCYVEVKGYETDRDQAKWSAFPHKLVVIKHKEIQQIRNNTFMLNV